MFTRHAVTFPLGIGVRGAWLDGDPMLAGALLSWRIEQLAVRLGGSVLVAATTHALLPLVWPKAPWFAAPAAGFIGLLLFPTLYRRLLP